MNEEIRKPSPIDGYMLVKKIGGMVLGITTFFGAMYIGATQADTLWMKIIMGLFAGFVAYVSIDLLLGAVIGDLLHRGQHSIGKWLLMGMLLILTGGTTFIFGLFVSEDISQDKTTDQKQMLRASVLDVYTDQINDNQKSADALKKEIRSITYTFKKDTATMIAGMRENHRNLYRKGAHGKYMKRSGYYQLQESVNRVEDRIKKYENLIESKQASLSALETGLAEMRVSDPLETINAELVAEAQAKKRMGDIVKGMIWIFDVSAVLSLLFSFIFIKSILKKDTSIEVPENEMNGWILERWANLSKKMLESTDGADEQLSAFSSSVLGLLWGLMATVGWLARAVTWIITSVTKIDVPGQPKYYSIPSSPDRSPSSSLARATIGFHPENNPGENPVNKPGEMLVKSPGEQPVKMGGKNPAKLGATQVSAGERKLVNAPGEQLVNGAGEQSKKGAGEQVVNVKVVNGAPVFHHYSAKLSEMKTYTRNEVSRFESKYRNEASNIEDWIKKNQNTAPIEKVMKKKEQMQDRKRKHAYWLAGLNEMDKKKS